MGLDDIKIGDYLLLEDNSYDCLVRTQVKSIEKIDDNLYYFGNFGGYYNENLKNEDENIKIVGIENNNKGFVELNVGDSFLNKSGENNIVTNTKDNIIFHKKYGEELVNVSKFSKNGRQINWYGYESNYSINCINNAFVGEDIIEINGKKLTTK